MVTGTTSKGKYVPEPIERKFPNAKCEECPLARRKVVRVDVIEPTKEGQIRPAIFACGEGPHKEEVVQGHTFAGKSGLILREGARDKGLLPYGMVLNNAIACDTRSIKATRFDSPESAKEKEELLKKAVEACSGRLWDDIEAAQPDLILVLGGTAKEALTPRVKKGILALSGTIYVSPEDWSFAYALHPAAVINSEDGDRLIDEFLTGLNEARLFFEAREFETEIHIAKTTADVREFVKALVGSKYLVADVESTTFYPWDRGIGRNPPSTEEQIALAKANGWTLQGDKVYEFGKMLSLQLCGNGKDGYVIPGPLLAIKSVKKILAVLLKTHPIICHNTSFDIPWLKVYIDPDIVASDDTMFISYSTNESPFHSLKRIARAELGVGDWSSVIAPFRPKRAVSFANIPPEPLYEYGGKDVITTWQLVTPLRSKQDANDRRLYEETLMPVNTMFTKMSTRGVAIDVNDLAETHRLLVGRATKARTYLVNEYGLNNPLSSPQTRRVLTDDGAAGGFGLELPPDSTTGKALLEGYTIKEKTKDVEDWEWDLSEFSKAVLNYRRDHKAANTYVADVARSLSLEDAIKREDGHVLMFVHPDYELWATVTGRIVIKGPTLTNYSKVTGYAGEIRHYWVPRPGYVWFHYDYKQFELRVYACLTSDERMIEILTSKDAKGKFRDPHFEVGLEIYGPDFGAKNERTNGTLRMITKTCVFGRLYNRQAKAISQQLEIPLKEAERICAIIDSYFSGLGDYKNWVADQIMTQQRLINPLGRSRRFPLVTEENWQRCLNMGCNYMIQSTASDLNLRAVLEVTRQLPDVFPLFTIHDSGELEIPEDKASIYIPQIIEILRTFPQQFFDEKRVPAEVDFTVGERWIAK